MMDIDETAQTIQFTFANGNTEKYTYQGFGDNAVQRVIANKSDVVKVEVFLPKSGAVTELNFCPVCV